MNAASTLNQRWFQPEQWRRRSDRVLRLVARILRPALLMLGRSLFRLLLRLTVIRGRATDWTNEPLLVVANHFSAYDALLLTLYLPFQPMFIVAIESQRLWSVRLFLYMFGGIPVWRGQVDRTALRQAQENLRCGRSLCIFPEGGINPELVERVARGEVILQLAGNTARVNGELIKGKAGAAFLAVHSGVRVLPVALRGSENIGANLRRLRRTDVSIHIDAPIGPFRLDQAINGHERRLELERLTDLFMRCIASHFPLEKRGPYCCESATTQRRQGAES